MSEKGTIIHSLTSLRFFAAMGVFLHHLGYLNHSSIPWVKEAARYFFNGYSGVTFFYILSGFIISYSYKNHREKGRFDKKDFLAFRLVRLFPVHLLALLSMLYLFGQIQQPALLDMPVLLSNIFLYNSFVPDLHYVFSFNPVSWSISCEIFFYISFCVLVVLNTSALCSLFLFIIAANIYFLMNPQVVVSDYWLFYVNPFFRISDFIAGMLIYRAFSLFKSRPSYKCGTFMEVFALAALAFTVYISTNYISNYSLRYGLLFVPAMILMVAAFSLNSGAISKALSNKYLTLLGEASFSFYMFHWIVINKVYETQIPDINKISSILTHVFLSLFIAITLSILIFKIFEMPVNSFLRKAWLNARTGNRVTAH